MQRLPPRNVWRNSSVCFRVGQQLQLDQLETTLLRLAYRLDERVDEPGEAAIRSEVVDIYPAGSDAPYRLDHRDGRITEIRRFDPLTQRTMDEVEELRLDPASEVILNEPSERFRGIEHWLPQIYGAAETLFDYLPAAAIVLDAEVDDRRAGFIEQIADAYASRSALLGVGESDRRRPLTPDALYLDNQEWEKQLGSRAVIELSGDPGKGAVPRLAEMRDPSEAFGEFVGERLAAGDRVVLAAATTGDLRILERAVQRELDIRPLRREDWGSAAGAAPGTIGTLTAELAGGFVCDGMTVVAFADLTGVRTRGSAQHVRTADDLNAGEVKFRLGDAVIHLDHGMAILRGLETIEAGGAASEVVKLEYAGDTNLLAPIDEIGRIWRYGTEGADVTLDRLDGEGWAKRRAAVEEHVAKTAHVLLELAQAREKAAAPVLLPPQRDYARFAARFPFTETEDQARAIEAALRDLASGKPMDRLVCGDVGYGKTEIALRGTAAAVLAGKQAALVAPTTVLVRQHLQIFRSRFAGFGLRVEALSRLATPAEARAVRKGLANGEVRIVIGTHALAGKQVRFHDLGLLVIDEEQRFGVKQKERLRALGSRIHVLTLTATPIPRTMQAAMVGLQQVSVIATPPARRQPIRTFLLPFDPVTAREALMREQRRGGQSFVVCPRVEDIPPMKERLNEIAPELQVLTAHAKMPAAELDDVMVRFADGEGDVLLSTNIIENGLDIPRANTMLI